MRVALMLPCYIDMFYPQVGVAPLELLEKLGVEVDHPLDQTCCGQPMANSGAHKEAKASYVGWVCSPQRQLSSRSQHRHHPSRRLGR